MSEAEDRLRIGMEQAALSAPSPEGLFRAALARRKRRERGAAAAGVAAAAAATLLLASSLSTGDEAEPAASTLLGPDARFRVCASVVEGEAAELRLQARRFGEVETEISEANPPNLEWTGDGEGGEVRIRVFAGSLAEAAPASGEPVEVDGAPAVLSGGTREQVLTFAPGPGDVLVEISSAASTGSEPLFALARSVSVSAELSDCAN